MDVNSSEDTFMNRSWVNGTPKSVIGRSFLIGNRRLAMDMKAAIG